MIIKENDTRNRITHYCGFVVLVSHITLKNQNKAVLRRLLNTPLKDGLRWLLKIMALRLLLF